MTMRLPLNDEQKAAITTGADRVFIEAAPGAGKTTVATERFGLSRFGRARDGRGVVAVSFARSARGELDQRVRRRWGSNALRWPHKVWTLDSLHFALVQHLLRSGAITWPAGVTELQVVDTWRGHKGSWPRPVGSYIQGLWLNGTIVTIGNGNATLSEYAFSGVGPYRAHLEAGLCTHTEIRQVLGAAIAKDSGLKPIVTDFLKNTIATLIVDEVFDGNMLDLAIVYGAASTGIPTTLIGDPWQALYAFRGARPELVPQVVANLKFETLGISESFRFETTEMQTLAEALRAGQPVVVSGGPAQNCDVVLASEWARLWTAGHCVLPLSFGQASNRVDAAIALLLDHVVSQRFGVLSTFGSDAAVMLGLDPEVLRADGAAQLAPVVETLGEGTEQAAKEGFALLRSNLLELGSRSIPNLQAAKMTERYARLIRLSERLAGADVIPGLTIHQAKGREWSQVGVALSDPERARLAKGLEQDSEDDRALYVALTRARHETRLVG